MRSDPLPLAQIAKGKQRYVQFRCPRPRGTARAFPNDRAPTEKARRSLVRIDFIASWSVYTDGMSLFASVPSNLPRVHLCSGVNSYEKSRRRIGNVVQSCSSSVAPRCGDRKIHGRKNHRRKDRPADTIFSC